MFQMKGQKFGSTLQSVENEAVCTKTPETPVMNATAIETMNPMTPNQKPAMSAPEEETAFKYHQVRIAIRIAATTTKVMYCAVNVPVPAGTKAAIAAITLLTR